MAARMQESDPGSSRSSLNAGNDERDFIADFSIPPLSRGSARALMFAGFTLLALGAMAQERPPYGQEIGVAPRGAVFISEALVYSARMPCSLDHLPIGGFLLQVGRKFLGVPATMSWPICRKSLTCSGIRHRL